ncbi:MAG: hypothetical protein U9R47_11245, partial [Actinomycetota bacterium]|nr:hypothetical protein [Actinomycetota bacterium]
MNDLLFGTSLSQWVAFATLIFLLPVLIIVAGEIEERLRIRGSLLEKAVATVRTWLLPLASAWALLVVVFRMSESSFVARILATGMLIALTVAALQLLRHFVDDKRGEFRIPGTQGVPQLLMMLPRLLIILAAG